jgi:heptosyltransferase-1
MNDAIIKLSSLGDIIHSLAVLPLLNRKIDFIVDSSFKEILDYHPLIGNVIDVSLRKAKKDKSLFIKEYKKLKRHRYENVYDLQGLLKSAIIGKIISENLTGYKNPREKIASLFYNKKILSKKHYAVERYLELFGFEDENYLKNHPELLFYKDRNFDILSNTKKNIVFIIGATWECKKLPKEKWLSLANELKENIIIPYYTDEEKKDAFFIAKSPYVTPVKLNLNDLKALISKADLLIGNDTGPSFIAWANNINNILLYGCTYNNKIIENRYSKSVEVQKGKIDKKLGNIIRNIDIKDILKKVESFK